MINCLLIFSKKPAEGKNKIVLNVCYVKNSDVDPSRVLPLLKYVDIFLPNEEEARAITKENVIGKQAKTLLSAGAKNVAITMGDQGLYASDENSEIRLGTYPVNVVDPSGCGDCFTAGMIAGIRRDWDFFDSLNFGSATGALGATALGCTTGIPAFHEIQEFILVNTIAYSK